MIDALTVCWSVTVTILTVKGSAATVPIYKVTVDDALKPRPKA